MLSLRRNKFLYIICFLALLNIIIFWLFIGASNKDNRHYGNTTKDRLIPSIDVTIIIPAFESFDHDLLNTVNDLLSKYSTLSILILSKTFPYPYPKINDDRVKFVYKQDNPMIPHYQIDPLNFIKTPNILVLPDGARTEKNSIEILLRTLHSREAKIIVAPIATSSKCMTIDFELKLWTLTFNAQDELLPNCDFIDQSAILFNKHIITNFSEIFATPFYESFFIQAKVNNLKVVVERKRKLFKLGKLLFGDSHFNWKHKVNKEKEQKALYQRFGVKRLITSSGQEKWFGCSKNAKRCFPSVLDVPYFLYQGRWTPPCCLNALRETARHVFSVFEKSNIVYWLEGGSLLGAARHGDIIPWDYDVDIGMYMSDINKVSFLKKIWGGEKFADGEGFVWERASEGDFFRVQYSSTNHLHVDIFPFYEKNGVMTKNTWFKSHRQDMEFPAWYLKPLKRLKFVGVDAMVPNYYRDFLELKFGSGVIENPQYPFPEKLLGVSF